MSNTYYNKSEAIEFLSERIKQVLEDQNLRNVLDSLGFFALIELIETTWDSASEFQKMIKLCGGGIIEQLRILLQPRKRILGSTNNILLGIKPLEMIRYLTSMKLQDDTI